MSDSGSSSPGGENVIVTALSAVFGPIVKLSSKWPPLLAYGLPGIVAVMLIVLLRSAVPDNLVWLMAAVITLPLVGYIITDIYARRSAEKVGGGGAPRLEASFEEPRRKSTVTRTIVCRGTASGIPKDMHLWLAVEANGFVWPKEGEVLVDKNSSRWAATIFEDGATASFDVSLLLANPDGHKFIRDWLEAGIQKGEYAEMKGIPGTQRIARVERLRLSKRV